MIVWLLVLGITVIVIGTIYKIQTQESIQSMRHIGPWTIWWYVDDKKNRPYLQVCLRRAKKLWGNEFTIVPIMGREAALKLLLEKHISVPDGADRAPPDLWNHWLRATMLAHLGGLWIDGSVLPLATGSELKQKLMGDRVIVFESAGWASSMGQSEWTTQTDTLTEIINQGESYWSTFNTQEYTQMISVDAQQQVCSYEDLFERTTCDTTMNRQLWVSLPPGGSNKLEMASKYLWFVNLSEEEIANSDFVWAKLSQS